MNILTKCKLIVKKKKKSCHGTFKEKALLYKWGEGNFFVSNAPNFPSFCNPVLGYQAFDHFVIKSVPHVFGFCPVPPVH